MFDSVQPRLFFQGKWKERGGKRGEKEEGREKKREKEEGKKEEKKKKQREVAIQQAVRAEGCRERNRLLRAAPPTNSVGNGGSSAESKLPPNQVEPNSHPPTPPLARPHTRPPTSVSGQLSPAGHDNSEHDDPTGQTSHCCCSGGRDDELVLLLLLEPLPVLLRLLLLLLLLPAVVTLKVPGLQTQLSSALCAFQKNNKACI